MSDEAAKGVKGVYVLLLSILFTVSMSAISYIGFLMVGRMDDIDTRVREYIVQQTQTDRLQWERITAHVGPDETRNAVQEQRILTAENQLNRLNSNAESTSKAVQDISTNIKIMGRDIQAMTKAIGSVE
jgi:hypothetical protein